MARQGNQRNSERERIGSSEGTMQESTRPSEDRIRQRAYERYQERGGEHGRDTDDWFEAEREVGGETVSRNRDQDIPSRQGDSIDAGLNSDRERDTH